MSDQVEISSPPGDSLSSLKFSPSNGSHLLATSWDNTVRIYDVAANAQLHKFEHRAAVLTGCFGASGTAYAGGLDTGVHEHDFARNASRTLGRHTDAVSASCFSPEHNMLYTGSWDCSLRAWDPRAAPGAPQSSHTLSERVYAADLVGNTLVLALASRQFRIFDVRKLAAGAEQERESSLKFMTRSLACMPNGLGYATGSVEGRIAVEYFDTAAEAQEKKYAFKCHRQTIDDVDHVWPVNALAFHPIYNTFASAGSDGTLSVWDHALKKRLRQYPKYSGPISTLAFSPSGDRLAVGISYTWDEGAEGAKSAEPPKILIRTVGDEVKPKGWTA